MPQPPDLLLGTITGVLKDAAAGFNPVQTTIVVTPNFTQLSDLPGGTAGDTGSVIVGFAPLTVDTSVAKTMPATPVHGSYSTDGDGSLTLKLIGWSELVNPTKFTYTMEIKKKSTGEVLVPAFSFELPAGVTLDFSALVKVKVSAGTGVPTIILPQASSGPVTSSNITDATTVGRQLITATDAAAARDKIGAGTSNLQVGTGAGDAKSATWQPSWPIQGTPTQFPPLPHNHTPAAIGASEFGAAFIVAVNADAGLTALGVTATGKQVVKAANLQALQDAVGVQALIDAAQTAALARVAEFIFDTGGSYPETATTRPVVFIGATQPSSAQLSANGNRIWLKAAQVA